MLHCCHVLIPIVVPIDPPLQPIMIQDKQTLEILILFESLLNHISHEIEIILQHYKSRKAYSFLGRLEQIESGSGILHGRIGYVELVRMEFETGSSSVLYQVVEG